MSRIADDTALDLLFRDARSHNQWTDQPVTDEEIKAVFDLMKWAPTSANCSPSRFVFIRSDDAKEKLRPFLLPGNVDKTMSAPVTVIIATDPKFYDHLPKLFPHEDARAWFAGEEKTALAATTAFRNGTLQGAYFMLAARALGLDCGPMSGFDNAGVDQAFFGSNGFLSNFLVNIGHGDPAGLMDRHPRFDFTDVCHVL